MFAEVEATVTREDFTTEALRARHPYLAERLLDICPLVLSRVRPNWPEAAVWTRHVVDGALQVAFWQLQITLEGTEIAGWIAEHRTRDRLWPITPRTTRVARELLEASDDRKPDAGDVTRIVDGLHAMLGRTGSEPGSVWVAGSERMPWNQQFMSRAGQRLVDRRARQAESEAAIATPADVTYDGDDDTPADIREFMARMPPFGGVQARSPWRRLIPPERGEGKAAAEFVAAVNRHCPDISIPADSLKAERGRSGGRVTARIRPIGFYDLYDLVEVTEHEGGRARTLNLLWARDESLVPTREGVEAQQDIDAEARARALEFLPHIRPVVGLDGKSATFLFINRGLEALGRFSLDAETVREYAIFFATWLQDGQSHLFLVPEMEEDIDWRGGSRPDRRRMRDVIRPSRAWQVPEFTLDGTTRYPFVIQTPMIKGNQLAYARLAVSRVGEVHMLADTIVSNDLRIVTPAVSRRDRFLLADFSDLDS